MEVAMPRWTLALAVPALLFADASGTWTFSSVSLPPDLTCKLAVKEGRLAGSCSAVNTRLEIEDGSIDRRTVKWTVNVPSDTGITTAYTFTGEMDDAERAMKGTLTISSVTGTERGTFTAKRQ
jgi:hypothetical protein